MNDPTARCVATDNDERCASDATARTPVALCTRHRMQVAMGIAPEMLGFAAQRYADENLTRTAQPITPTFHGTHEPIVYFILNGNRVKIGYTTNLIGRVRALAQATDNVILTLAGGRELESALHDRFARFRVGNSEWFEYRADIRAYVSSKDRKDLHTTTNDRPSTDAEAVRDAAELIVHSGIASASMLQRRLRVGFARAGRLMDQLEQMGIVGALDGPGSSRSVLVTPDQLPAIIGSY